jgi:hypothetical protein
MTAAQFAQRRIPLRTRSLLYTIPLLRVDLNAARVKPDAQCKAFPLAMGEPVIGIPAETMMDVEGKQFQAMRPCICTREMEQRSGIQSSAIRDGHTDYRSRNARQDRSKRAFESVLDGRCLPGCHGIIPAN